MRSLYPYRRYGDPARHGHWRRRRTHQMRLNHDAWTWIAVTVYLGILGALSTMR